MITTPGCVWGPHRLLVDLMKATMCIQEAGDLKVTEGDIILLTERTSDDWWVIVLFPQPPYI